jgi:LemA protein
MIWVAVGAVVVILLWFLGTYNGLVRLRNHVKESWSDVDTELKRRHDLIPNLVETVKGYARHERDVFDRVTAARSRAMSHRGSVAAQAADEAALGGSLKGLLAVAEGYPDLKANRNFLELQRELANTEDRIQAARRFYNANVRDLNNRVERVPSNLVATMGNFAKAEFFEADAGERVAPRVEI